MCWLAMSDVGAVGRDGGSIGFSQFVEQFVVDAD